MPSPDLPRRRLVRPGALPQARLVQLPGVFGINRNARSASAEIGVRLPRKSAFGLVRNGRSFSSVLHNRRCTGMIARHALLQVHKRQHRCLRTSPTAHLRHLSRRWFYRTRLPHFTGRAKTLRSGRFSAACFRSCCPRGSVARSPPHGPGRRAGSTARNPCPVWPRSGGRRRPPGCPSP